MQDGSGARSSQLPDEAAAEPAVPAEAPAGKQPRPRKKGSRKVRHRLRRAPSQQGAEPAAPAAAVQQGPPCAAKDVPSSPPGHASVRRSDGAEAAKPPVSPSSPVISKAHALETALSSGSPKPSSNPGVLPAHASEAPEPCAADDEDGQAPSPLPSCFTAISVDKAHEMVQGLADDLNPGPFKLALEPAALASATEDAPGASPGQAQPSVGAAHAGSIDVAAVTGQSLRVDHSKAAPSQTTEDRRLVASTKAAKGTRLSEPSGRNQIPSDTRKGGQKLDAAAEEGASLPGKEVLAGGVAIEKTLQGAATIAPQSAVPTGKDASSEVPARGSAAQAAAQQVTPATSSNASQQCNADASMVSQAACQQDTGSAQGGGVNDLQASQNSQDHAALNQGRAGAKPAAVNGDGSSGSQPFQGLAAHDKSSNGFAQPAANVLAIPAASGLDKLEGMPNVLPVQPSTVDATASRDQINCQPRRPDRRKSITPAR